MYFGYTIVLYIKSVYPGQKNLENQVSVCPDFPEIGFNSKNKYSHVNCISD